MRAAEGVANRSPTREAAVLFTSGATGPPKGVVYRHSQLRAQLELVRAVCGITPDDRLVAAFAPFALYGPALGIGAAVPRMDVTRPGTLTAARSPKRPRRSGRPSSSPRRPRCATWSPPRVS